jgi:hypothetical protein
VSVNAVLLLRVGLQHSNALVMFTGIWLCAASALMVHTAGSRSKMLSVEPVAPAACMMLLATVGVVVGCTLAALAMMSLPLGVEG